MRNRASNLIWGILLIVLGVALLGGVMDWWDFDLFFDGWWTLFIIVPCAISMVQSGVHTGNVVGLSIGAVLLLQAQDLFPVHLYKLILPAVLVVVGLTLLFRRNGQRPPDNQTYHYENGGTVPPGTTGTAGGASYSGAYTPPPPGAARKGGPNHDPFALFSGSEACFAGFEYRGGSATAVFGGVELDLRGAIITQDVTITATAVFGGVDIIVDDRVQVRYSSVPILGGTGCSVGARDPQLPTVYVNSVAVFGGVDIK